MSQPGIHHITAIAGDARTNVAFYTGMLGLRLVKKTVNFDDPGTYHFYYGDEAGRPGTILTFFPWTGVPKGRTGAGEVTRIDFRAPVAAYDFWAARLAALREAASPGSNPFGEHVIDFRDPDGMALRLVFADAQPAPPWTTHDISAAHAITGFHAAAMTVSNIAATEAVVTEIAGFKRRAEQAGVIRLSAGHGAGAIVDLIPGGNAARGQQGAGTVHHIAFRADSDATQERMAQTLNQRFRIGATEQRDRNYFRSVYFREPSGILFEIATDDPGFAIDEPLDQLGQALKLPAQYEQHRAAIESVLPRLA